MTKPERNGLRMEQYYEEHEEHRCAACTFLIVPRERYFSLAYGPDETGWIPSTRMKICFPCIRSAGRRVAELDADEAQETPW